MLDTRTAAIGYAARGWAVIPVAPMSRKPIESGWPGRLYRTADEIDAMLARHPACNIGIVTGAASGIWVLDVDPQSGGDRQAAALVAAYGPLTETYTVRTPSGGLHYYFVLPDDFEPRNAQHGGGRLPIGIDVRGRAGQVVAPPSRRENGDYSVVLDVPVARAPEWLVDLIRPRPVAAPESWMPPPAPIEMGGASRGLAYAAASVAAVTDELANAAMGTRNETAYRVARRCWELINSPWSGLAPDAVHGAYMAAAAMAARFGDFPVSEAERCWTNAQRDAAGQGVGLPDSTMYGTLMRPEQWPPGAADFSTASTAAATPGLALIDPLPPAAAPASPDPHEAAIGAEVYRQWVRREAQRRLVELGRPRRDFGAEIIDSIDLEAIPDPEWLVTGWLYRNSMARLIGPSGAGKSFISIDLACSVATGRTWHQRPVAEGVAVLVVGEGLPGIRRRQRAWEAHHEVTVARGRLLVVPAPVQVDSADWDGLCTYLAAVRPVLITLDTQARMTAGINENDATEMQRLVDSMDRLRRATGACVLGIHHRAPDAAEARGSRAVRGAMDSELDASIRGSRVTLVATKEKDDALPDKLVMQLVPLGDSAVLLAAGDPGTTSEGMIELLDPAAPGGAAGLPSQRTLILIAVMRDQFGLGNGGTQAEIKRAFLGHPSLASGSDRTRARSFNQAWGHLEELGRIARNPAAGQRFKYVEIDGLDDLEPNPKRVTDYGWPVLTPRV